MAVQWISVIAVAVVAGVGLHRVFVEFTDPPPAASVIEREQIQQTELETPSAEEPWFELPEETPREVEQSPVPAVRDTTPGRPPAPEPTRASVPEPESPYTRPAEAPIVVYRSQPSGSPEQGVRETTIVESERAASLVDRLRDSLGELQELAGEVAQDTASSEEEIVSSDLLEQIDSTQPTGPPDSVGGVVVVSLRWNGREVPANVCEDSKHDVTLVTFGGHGRSRPATGSPPEATQAVAQPNGHDTYDAAADVYYFRFLAGSSVDSLDPQLHGLMGEDLQVMPTGKASPWADAILSAGSLPAMDLTSTVALDPVWFPARTETTQTEFVAAVGGRLFNLTVAGAPSAYDGWHEMSVEISPRVPDRNTRETLEVQVLVERNRLVVLRAPGVSLPARYSDERGPLIDTTLVALTTLSSPEVDVIRVMDSMFDEDPRAELIPIEGPQPVLPVGFPLGRAMSGDVRLRVLVLASGEPLSVVATETTFSDAEYLIESIVSAVRQWRFYPPALGSGKIGGYFDITVGPDGEIRP